MDIAHSIPSTVASISFSFLTAEDIRRISVRQIVNPVLLDALNRPNVGGLYDPALGPGARSDICGTCRLTFFACPGHYGHIELPAPVYHPLFMVNMYNLLRGCCLYCHQFKMGRATLCKYVAKLRLLEHGLLEAAADVDRINQKRNIRRAAVADSDEEDETDGVEESVEEFEGRLNLFVRLHLHRASGSKRDDYKDGLVYQKRKELIAEFLKNTLLKKCLNCGAFVNSLRKEGSTKIIRYALTEKQTFQHKLAGIKLHDIFALQGNAPQPGATEDDSDAEMESSEGEGDATHSGDETSQLPRAANGRVKTMRGRREFVMAPGECRAHLRALFEKEAVMCSLLYGRHGPFSPVSAEGISRASADMFFMDVLPVSPTRFRPPAKLGETLFEHPQNELLAKVLKTSFRLRDLTQDLRNAHEIGADGKPMFDATKVFAAQLESLIQLQVDVNSFVDSSKNPAPVRQGKLPPPGIKQGLEKKEGLFRKHMMGKRVNYAARSVISPDVNIETNEIGIPPVFARKLTYPEPVTSHNIHQMRQLVIDGPTKYPGASMVKYEDGSTQHLDKLTTEQRTAIANQLLTVQEGSKELSSIQGLNTRTAAVNKKVYRHLRDGDILILNRQPTLHKPSMMAHKARVLKGEKTIRMHYANCNSYNADFDGDEMNIHFPQNQIARAEALQIANTDNQYLVPTSGEPLRGLIQDHVVAGVWMTNKSTWFSREEYQQILYGALRPENDYSGGGRVLTLPPAMWKPRALWSGKQIISTVLLNIVPPNAAGLNLHTRARVPNKFWGPHSSEEQVIFTDGELLCGVLDKSQFGATSYGLVHSVYELYGAEVAGRLLSILSRLFTKFLQHRGFTCRMDDLALTPAGDAARRDEMEKGTNFGTEAAMDNFPSLADLSSAEKKTRLPILLEDVLRSDAKMAGLDHTVKLKLRDLTKNVAEKSIPEGLLRRFPDNHMQAMVMTGAKGSDVNARQISCGLGQQELEGRRVPVMVSGKTLPSFKPFETAAIAGGYVASRFLTGLKPQEFYFHCMAGREGLIDTAVKTSRSGYLQRCLIKHLEGIRVHYDHTVRGSDSSIYQFHYGGDALDVTKQRHLLNADKQHQLFDFTASNTVSFINKCRPRNVTEAGVVNDVDAPASMKKALKKPEKYAPTLSQFSPSLYLGSTSERFARAVDDYVKSDQNLLKPKKNAPEDRRKARYKGLMSVPLFRTLMNVRYLQCLVDPGEAVGLLASQGVGEPSTQMTLNTFHFAGHGAANVTLGIPRLREIVMTASRKPKTPSMVLPVRAGVTHAKIDAFCKAASRLTLSQIVDDVSVTERLISEGTLRRRQFTVDIRFFPKKAYQAEYQVQTSDAWRAVAAGFAGMLNRAIHGEIKKLTVDLKNQAAEIGKGRAVRETGAVGAHSEEAGDEGEVVQKRGGDEGSEVGDGDAEDEKRARQQKQQATYESDEEEQEEEGADDTGPMNLDAIDKEFENDSEADDSDRSSSADSADTDMVDAQKEAVEQFCKLVKDARSCVFREDGSGVEFVLQFSCSSPKLLLVGIIERCCAKTVIREIPGISRCLHVKKGKEDLESEPEKMQTEGCNFTGVWDRADDTIDVHKITSNDIWAIRSTYGVEMARTTILHEIQSVFNVYKINVDSRHIALIADYMTYDGGYRPFNSMGISANSSPLLKASFERTATFLSDAALYGDFDNLHTPSGNIVMGRPSVSGTGVFDIVTPLPSF